MLQQVVAARVLVALAVLLCHASLSRAEESISQRDGVLTLEASRDICLSISHISGTPTPTPVGLSTRTCVSQLVGDLAALSRGLDGHTGDVSDLTGSLAELSGRVDLLRVAVESVPALVTSVADSVAGLQTEYKRSSEEVTAALETLATLQRELNTQSTKQAAALGALTLEVTKLQIATSQMTACTAKGALYDPAKDACYVHPCDTTDHKCPLDSTCRPSGATTFNCSCNAGFIPHDGACRVVEPCGREQKYECGEHQVCHVLPGSDENTCICAEGTLPNADGLCQPWQYDTEMSFWTAMQSWDLSQYIREGSPKNGIFYPESFWVDEVCATCYASPVVKFRW